MLHVCGRLASILLWSLAPSGLARAASLSVSPILVEVGGAASTATVTLRNREARPINAQVRIFRWTQDLGQDQLVPTADVVASPPIVTIAAGEDYTVRVRRIAGSEPAGEEAYRVVVDELPNPNRQRNGTVAVVLRYLIPTFFMSEDASQPRLKWSLTSAEDSVVLRARNEGDKRIQILDLAIRSSARTTWVGKGLAGYVLGHSDRVWTVPVKTVRPGGSVVVARSDHGPINARLDR